MIQHWPCSAAVIWLHLLQAVVQTMLLLRQATSGCTLMSRMRWKSVGVPEGSSVKKLGTKCSGRLPTTLSRASHLCNTVPGFKASRHFVRVRHGLLMTILPRLASAEIWGNRVVQGCHEQASR